MRPIDWVYLVGAVLISGAIFVYCVELVIAWRDGR